MAEKSTTQKTAKNTDKRPAQLAVVAPEMVEIRHDFQKWLDRARALGLHQRDIVWELHVVLGKNIRDTAAMMGITPQRVGQLWKELQHALIEKAPKQPEDFIILREELKGRLMSVYDDAAKHPNDSRMLAIRLKTLDQLAKLHGLNMETPALAADAGGVACVPDEIAALVEERRNSVHGRAQDIAEAIEGQEMRDVSPKT